MRWYQQARADRWDVEEVLGRDVSPLPMVGVPTRRCSWRGTGAKLRLVSTTRSIAGSMRQDGSLVSPDRSDLRGNGTGELRNEMLDRSLRIEYLALAYDPEAVLDRVARLSAPSNAT
jgi:hypothetical protein